ncbi:hypothetical protein HF576_03015 [Microbacterium sp. CFH 90308]|uniref:DUF2510 domain-containing protein n=1 Tax=Microbacterium salsuginis TaxID=2722803 RepID=A0ABX1K9Z8_9MICO|nr:hypothetical protein [Microbacterium sp. CFH 90308]NLP82808.1 hypothetical protein [Microbacterium sp. CFH 90308]
MRVIRVPNVAADFRVPPGWPAPTNAWIRANAFWNPPEGWVPLDHLRPAPTGWKYWRPNPTWNRMSARLFGRVNALRRVGDWLVIVWIVLLIVRLSLPPLAALNVLSITCALAALACLIIAEGLRARQTRSAMKRIASVALEEREKRLVRNYQKYLLEAP